MVRCSGFVVRVRARWSVLARQAVEAMVERREPRTLNLEPERRLARTPNRVIHCHFDGLSAHGRAGPAAADGPRVRGSRDRSARDGVGRGAAVPDGTAAEAGRARACRGPVPEEYGGAALSAVDYCICIEELARVCPAVALSVAAHNGLCSAHISMFGSAAAEGSSFCRGSSAARCWARGASPRPAPAAMRPACGRPPRVRASAG